MRAFHTAYEATADVTVDIGSVVRIKVDAPVRAYLSAQLAMLLSQAYALLEGQFRITLLGFRITTPSTAQWTSLEKNKCPNPTSVMHAEMLDVEDDS